MCVLLITSWGTRWVLAVGDKAVGSTKWDILPEDAAFRLKSLEID